jgi:hypothetical protein
LATEDLSDPADRLPPLAAADADRPPAGYAGSSCAASEILSARHTSHPAYSSHTSLLSFRNRPMPAFQLFPSTPANSRAGKRYKCNKCNKCKNGLNLVFNWNTHVNNRLQQN